MQPFQKIAKLKTFDQLVPLQFGESQSPLFGKVGNVWNVNDQFIYWMVIWDEKSIIYENRKQSTQWLDHDEGLKPFCKTEIASSEYILSCGPPLENCNLTRASVRKFTINNWMQLSFTKRRQLLFSHIFHDIKYSLDMIVSLNEKHLFREDGGFSEGIVVVLKVRTEFIQYIFLIFIVYLCV